MKTFFFKDPPLAHVQTLPHNDLNPEWCDILEHAYIQKKKSYYPKIPKWSNGYQNASENQSRIQSSAHVVGT